MKKKLKEWVSIQITRHPGRMVLIAILLFNVLFLVLSAVVIKNLALTGTEKMGFLEAVFCTVTMILDAGCIQFVIADIGTSGVAIAVICLSIVVIGMISFTGAVIGYVTNFISGFIENANSGERKLTISDHIVILNWNSRASEIVNDLLYCSTRQKVVVLVNSNRDEVEKEIMERLEDTVNRQNREVIESCQNLSLLKRYIYMFKNRFKGKVTVLVREGDIFSSKQLYDISVDKAKTVIILGSDLGRSVCRFEFVERAEELGKGNVQTIKTLMQVADLTAAETSADDQKIIVEITDEWTYEIVEKIIGYKQVEGKCNIVPIKVNHILGQILSQFSLMPELNMVYRELFSNRGATFYSQVEGKAGERIDIKKYLETHKHAVPLTSMSYKGKEFYFYSTISDKAICKESNTEGFDFKVKLNENYWIENKTIIILGHNSKCGNIMQGFVSFVNEWNDSGKNNDLLHIVVIDTEKNLSKMDYYKKYDFVKETVAAEIYDRELICETIERVVSVNEEDTSVLILSDESVSSDDIDSAALTNLIYVQDIINKKKKENPDFDTESIDVVVEIIDPKHHDIVNSYSVNNVVISNRYISKMLTQIGEKDAMFEFYNDILTYDDAYVDSNEEATDGNEIYIKKVKDFFAEIPPECTAEELIRGVYEASCNQRSAQGEITPTIVVGYVKPGGKMVLFGDDQSEIKVKLEPRDKIIVFSNC